MTRFVNNILQKANTGQIILGGFLGVILLGSVILMLPICSADGNFTPFIDALFTATTSVCVTGLVTVSTASHWSGFGQLIVLLLIQFGGLGIISLMISILMLAHERIGLKNRIIIQESYGLERMGGTVSWIKKVIKGTFVVEFIGFLCYLPVLVPEKGIHGIWDSLFLSISAFCNAGMDTLGENSLANYVGNYWVNFVTMALIILGGLGFVVWWEVIAILRMRKNTKRSLPSLIKKSSLHFKLVMTMTISLIVIGWIVVLIFDYNNPETLAKLTFPQKLVAALFQSVTTRTAGFYTVSQPGLSSSSSVVCMLLMLIGGSPCGTAGGVKTVTVALLILAVMAEARGFGETRVYHRSITLTNIRKAIAIILYSLTILFVCSVILLAVESTSLENILYEATSAMGTVGLSKDLTPSLHFAGKCIIIFIMYCGRIGPITLVTYFFNKGGNDQAHYPDETIFLG